MSLYKLNPPDPANPMALPTVDVSAIRRKWLDVDYTPAKPHPARKLDIYLPQEGNGPFPTIVCIHGGAFWGGQKNDMQIAAYLEGLEAGFAVVSVEQRLCSMLPDHSYSREGLFPNPVFDFKAAIRFLRANAGEYLLDPTRFAVAGGSAGGYHAIMAAATANVPAMYDPALGYADVDGTVQAVLDWFGVGDLVVQSRFTNENPFLQMPDGTEFPLDNYADVFLGVSCRDAENLAYFASPETWITPALPPVFLQHGTADVIVPIACSQRLAAKIEAVCGKDRIYYEALEGCGHGDPAFSTPENVAKMLAWLKAQLR